MGNSWFRFKTEINFQYLTFWCVYIRHFAHSQGRRGSSYRPHSVVGHRKGKRRGLWEGGSVHKDLHKRSRGLFLNRESFNPGQFIIYAWIFQHNSCDYFTRGRSMWGEMDWNGITRLSLSKQTCDRDACKSTKQRAAESTHKVNVLWLLKSPWYAAWIKNYGRMNHAVYPNYYFFHPEFHHEYGQFVSIHNFHEQKQTRFEGFFLRECWAAMRRCEMLDGQLLPFKRTDRKPSKSQVNQMWFTIRGSNTRVTIRF